MTPVAPAPSPVQPAPLDHLIGDWTSFAYSIADTFYAPGCDQADLRQEALIGLVKGLRTHDPARSSLKTFLALTVRAEVVTAVRAAQRMKHGPLNDSLRVVVLEGQEIAAIEVASDGRDVLDVLILRDEARSVVDAFATLTPLERHWMLRAINHPQDSELGYASKRYGRNKSAENAVDRARRKLRAAA